MDSRFHLKVAFSIYDQSYDWDCSLNWSAEPGQVDPRIITWFLNRHEEAYAKWNSSNLDRESELIKERELFELRRLMEKYPNER